MQGGQRRGTKDSAAGRRRAKHSSLTGLAARKDTPCVPSRNIVYEALVLRARESPRGDRIVGLMTAEAGLVDVFVFGGPKSKLRSLAAPYSAGRAFVYHDPVKDLSKLSDFDVREPFSGLREDLRKIWAAGLVAELLQKTSGGGGDYPLVLGLALDSLRSLEALPSERADYPALLFIWRMLGITGLMPDPGACASCGRDLEPGSPSVHAEEAGGFLCPSCARLGAAAAAGGFRGHSEAPEWTGRRYPLTAGALRWLQRSGEIPFVMAARTCLDAESLEGLKALVYQLARKAAEGPLASLQAGLDIL